MSIQILKILLETEQFCRVELIFGTATLDAIVFASAAELQPYLHSGARLSVELSYDQLLEAIPIENFEDKNAGIWEEGHNMRCNGRVHHIEAIEEDEIVDIYLQTGPNFLSVVASEFSQKPFLGQGVSILCGAIHFYPVWI